VTARATCRQEILAAAHALLARSGGSQFALNELLAEMRRSGTRYPASTIRTHVVSAMGVNAPRHHAVG